MSDGIVTKQAEHCNVQVGCCLLPNVRIQVMFCIIEASQILSYRKLRRLKLSTKMRQYGLDSSSLLLSCVAVHQSYVCTHGLFIRLYQTLYSYMQSLESDQLLL